MAKIDPSSTPRYLTVPQTRLEELQAEQREAEWKRAQFQAEAKACQDLGPAFDKHAHMTAWWDYLFGDTIDGDQPPSIRRWG